MGLSPVDVDALAHGAFPFMRQRGRRTRARHSQASAGDPHRPMRTASLVARHNAIMPQPIGSSGREVRLYREVGLYRTARNRSLGSSAARRCGRDTSRLIWEAYRSGGSQNAGANQNVCRGRLRGRSYFTTRHLHCEAAPLSELKRQTIAKVYGFSLPRDTWDPSRLTSDAGSSPNSLPAASS